VRTPEDEVAGADGGGGAARGGRAGGGGAAGVKRERDDAGGMEEPARLRARWDAPQGAVSVYTERAERAVEPVRPAARRKEAVLDPRFVDEDAGEDGDGGQEDVVVRRRKELEELGIRVDAKALAAEDAVIRVLGFGGFQSSKGKRMEENHSGAARGTVARLRRRVYRQYFNRATVGNAKLPTDRVYRSNAPKEKKES
jgi:U4/U6.U5 small nuclear ribonucleoproteins